MPELREDTCLDCGGCLGICPHEALDLYEGRIRVLDSCTECDLCVRLCPVDALVSIASPAGRA
ncbi:MAG TPA: 4Fe-4S binding protein [Candidatus Thermoplasmatota archaeon]|nr:4Fe-4S binding protein [Candidatus Thermoplasmatota archaeon]